MQIDGETMETWQTLFSWAPKSLQMVTTAMKLKDACSLGKSYNKLSILKSRDVTLSTKVHIVRAMIFPIVIYECESWTIKKAECQRIDAFELWCWRRLLRVPWQQGFHTSQLFMSVLRAMCILSGLLRFFSLWFFNILTMMLFHYIHPAEN